jgi:hypothetical protein
MSTIGSRFLCYGLPHQTDAEQEEGFETGRDQDRRKANVARLRECVQGLFNAFRGQMVLPDDTDYSRTMNALAKFLARGREAAYWAKASFNTYELADVQIDEPYRLQQQLRTLTQSLALVPAVQT